MRFADRRHAGEMLGVEVARLDPLDPVVYALPRGGVPVAFEVAKALQCPLDVLMVRKVGVPFQPELAMGAVAEGGVVIRNDEIIRMAGIQDRDFDSVAADERRELERRVLAYRPEGEAMSPEGRSAIVVDDGLATGSTALAAVRVLGEKGAAAVWLAVPVAPRGDLGQLGQVADRIVVLARPRDFGAVGYWYDDFDQTSESEVADLMVRSRLA